MFIDRLLLGMPCKETLENAAMSAEGAAIKFLSGTLVGFALFSVVSPWDVLFEGLFFVGVVPAVLYVAISRRIKLLSIHREIIWISGFLLFFSGMSLFLEGNSFADASDPLRYTVELIFFFVALSICVPYWKNEAALYSRAFFLIALAACLLGIFLYFYDGRFPNRLDSRSVSFLKNPNLGSGSIFGLWLVGFALLNQAREVKKTGRLLEGAAFFMLVLYIILAQSRGIGLAVAVFLFSLLFFRDLRQQALSKMALLLFLGLMSLGGGHFYSGSYDSFSLLENFSKRGLSYRLDIWWAAISHPPDNVLLGAGLGTDFFSSPAGEYLKNKFGFPFKHTHNMLLGIYYSCGVFGISVFLAIVARILCSIIKKNKHGEKVSSLLVVMVTVFVLTSTNSYHFVDKPRPIWLMFWLPFIVVVILSRPHRPQSSENMAKSQLKEQGL